ncbi:hypothetical protein DSECCO2_630440 [anaerobic digester metagenome]
MAALDQVGQGGAVQAAVQPAAQVRELVHGQDVGVAEDAAAGGHAAVQAALAATGAGLQGQVPAEGRGWKAAVPASAPSKEIGGRSQRMQELAPRQQGQGQEGQSDVQVPEDQGHGPREDDACGQGVGQGSGGDGRGGGRVTPGAAVLVQFAALLQDFRGRRQEALEAHAVLPRPVGLEGDELLTVGFGKIVGDHALEIRGRGHLGGLQQKAGQQDGGQEPGKSPVLQAAERQQAPSPVPGQQA